MSAESPLLLIVEDSESTRKLLSASLRGYDHIFAATAKEGFERYKRDRPDITVLDIGLPDAEGFKLLQAIKKEDCSAFIIMITANAEKRKVLESKKFGARGFIAKPFSRDRLEAYIKLYQTENSFG